VLIFFHGVTNILYAHLKLSVHGGVRFVRSCVLVVSCMFVQLGLG